jgi:hypothetical protein
MFEPMEHRYFLVPRCGDRRIGLAGVPPIRTSAPQNGTGRLISSRKDCSISPAKEIQEPFGLLITALLRHVPKKGCCDYPESGDAEDEVQKTLSAKRLSRLSQFRREGTFGGLAEPDRRESMPDENPAN